MDFKKICFNCLKEKTTEEGPCPHCGFDNSTYKWPSNQLAPLTPLNGRYILGRSLGAGGFGITYIALDLHLQVVVAIKELYLKKMSTREESKTISVSEKDKVCFEENKKRFLQEARVLAMFNDKDNEGIVIVKEQFEENNTAYIVMEYLDGITLKKMIGDKKMSYEEISALLQSVSSSLTRIHALNVVHLDISPDNIMIMKDGRAKLLDFGGAKNIEEKDDNNFVAFKRGYAPPEQYNEKGKIGQWTDVYALAATIYYCLTGKKPIDAMDRSAGAELICPSKMGVKIPLAVEQVLMQAMELDIEKRIQTVEEFWKRFSFASKNILEKRETNKKEKKGSPQLTKKKRIPIIVIAVILCVLFVGSIGGRNRRAYIEDEYVVSSTIENEVSEYNVGDSIPITLGTYVFECVEDSTLVMGVSSGFADDGASLLLNKASDRNSNRLAVTNDFEGDGFYNIHAGHTNSYIRTKDSRENGTVVGQYSEYSKTGTADWYFVYCGYDEEREANIVIIQNAAGSVLAPNNGEVVEKNTVVLADKDLLDDSQKWYMKVSEKNVNEKDVVVHYKDEVITDLSGTNNITSTFDMITRVAVTRNEFFEEPTLIVWEKVNAKNQEFELILQEDSKYKIFPMDQVDGERKCIEYNPEKKQFVLREAGNTELQLFQIVYAGYNTYYICTNDGLFLGYKISEDGKINGNIVSTFNVEEVEDDSTIKWFIKAPVGE